MPSQFSSGKHAIAECDRCGFRYKLKQLRSLVIKTKNVNILVCDTCWEPDQPQLSLGLYPVNDPQAVRNPRPDTSYYEQGNNGAGGSRVIQWGWNPVGGARSIDTGLTPNDLIAQGQVGDVTVTAAYVPITELLIIPAALYFPTSPPYIQEIVGITYQDYYYGDLGTYIPNPPIAVGLNNAIISQLVTSYSPPFTVGDYTFIIINADIAQTPTGSMVITDTTTGVSTTFMFTEPNVNYYPYDTVYAGATAFQWFNGFPVFSFNLGRLYTVTFTA